ncbi:ankyrin repeat domain-containing protein [Vreelandella sp. GE22]
MPLFKMWTAILLMAMALPACVNSPSYSTDPGYYFSEPAQRALAVAAGRGDIEAMQQALDQGADPNTAGEDAMTPLFWSAMDTMGANIDGFRYLLANGGDPNLVVVEESKPSKITAHLIHLAFTNQNSAFLEAALEAGSDPNTLVNVDETLLFERHTDVYIDQIRLLIEHGADVDFRGELQRTPLMNAISGSEYKTALMFIEAGADPTLTNEVTGRSALDTIKNFHDRESRYGGADYDHLINALKEKSYLDESF